MKYLKSFFMIAALVLSSVPAFAQHKAISPHESITNTVDGATITITYGRPFTIKPGTTEVRKIWGGLVPYGKVWRTGADAATTLTTDKALVFGSTTVPAGTYTLYTLPNEDGTAKLIINKQTGQWGTEYSEGQDLGRVDLKKSALDKSVDQFTIAIDASGVLKLSWENTEYSTAFTVQK